MILAFHCYRSKQRWLTKVIASAAATATATATPGRSVVITIASDVNKDWTHKDNDKDLIYSDLQGLTRTDR